MLSEQMIAFLKRHPTIYNVARYQLYSRLRSFNRKRIFYDAFRYNLWDGEWSASGIGSSLDATEAIRCALPGLLSKIEAMSLLDIPCGDFHWMQRVSLGQIRYIGADLVPELVAQNTRRYSDRGEFLCLDLLSDRLPRADAVFCRDCLVHLSLRDILRAVQNIKKAKPKFLITTTFPDQTHNADTVAPYWRPINMELAPFNFLKPLFLLRDFSDDHKHDRGKHLGVWALADIR